MNKKIIKTENAPAPIGPYNQGVESHNIIYLSGQIALDPETGNFVDGDVTAQTKQVMANIKGILNKAGLTFNNILKSSIFLKDLNDFDKVNEVYGNFFVAETAPARECVEVSRLPKDALVEISVVAVR